MVAEIQVAKLPELAGELNIEFKTTPCKLRGEGKKRAVKRIRYQQAGIRRIESRSFRCTVCNAHTYTVSFCSTIWIVERPEKKLIFVRSPPTRPESLQFIEYSYERLTTQEKDWILNKHRERMQKSDICIGLRATGATGIVVRDLVDLKAFIQCQPQATREKLFDEISLNSHLIIDELLNCRTAELTIALISPFSDSCPTLSNYLICSLLPSLRSIIVSSAIVWYDSYSRADENLQDLVKLF